MSLLLVASGCSEDEQPNVDGLVNTYNSTARTTQQEECNCYSQDLGYDSIEACVTDNFSPIVLSSCEQQAVQCNNQSYGKLLNCRQTAMTEFQTCIDGCPADPSSCRQDYQDAMAACDGERTLQLEADFAACRNGEEPACEGAVASDAGTSDAQPDAAQPDAAQPDAAQPDAAQPDAAQPDIGPDVGPDTGPEPDAAVNQAPSANAGADQSATVDQIVNLSGTGSDPDGDPLNYQWTIDTQPADSSPTLSDAQQAFASLSADKPGTYIVELTVSDGSLSASDQATIEFQADPNAQPCLIISEYVEGSGTNKAVELYNCGSSPVDLTPIRVCQASNEFNAIVDPCTLGPNPTGTLAAGDVYVVCNPGFSQLGRCDETYTQLGFNGNDRLAVYIDDGSTAYEHGTDVLLDAFGSLASPPPDTIWSEMTLRRCNFAPYDGVSTFAVADYYTEHPSDSFGDLGQVPTETCAP